MESNQIKPTEELEMVTITKEKYESLKADSRWARCLAMAGVDNWDGIVHARGLFIDLQENDL